MLLLACAAPATASIITLTGKGTVEGHVIRDDLTVFPPGTPISMTWHWDTNAENACQNLPNPEPFTGNYELFGEVTFAGWKYVSSGFIESNSINGECFQSGELIFRLVSFEPVLQLVPGAEPILDFPDFFISLHSGELYGYTLLGQVPRPPAGLQVSGFLHGNCIFEGCEEKYQLDGTLEGVVLPEPAAAALLALGCAVAAIRRRRHSR
jgi:hypothetical protein